MSWADLAYRLSLAAFIFWAYTSGLSRPLLMPPAARPLARNVHAEMRPFVGPVVLAGYACRVLGDRTALAAGVELALLAGMLLAWFLYRDSDDDRWRRRRRRAAARVRAYGGRLVAVPNR